MVLVVLFVLIFYKHVQPDAPDQDWMPDSPEMTAVHEQATKLHEASWASGSHLKWLIRWFQGRLVKAMNDGSPSPGAMELAEEAVAAWLARAKKKQEEQEKKKTTKKKQD